MVTAAVAVLWVLGAQVHAAVFSWGNNASGQLGLGFVSSQERSPLLLSVLGTVKALSAGADHTLAIRNDSTLWAFGANQDGQLGDGTTVHREFPIAVPLGSAPVAIACGANHSLALTTEGVVFAWGDNGFGQIGDGTLLDRPTPVPVPLPARAIKIAAGGRHSVALLEDGTVYAWGDNFKGQIGDGTHTNVRPNPTQTQLVFGTLSGVVDIAAGFRYNLALTNTGVAFSWGDNIYGQVGQGPSATNIFTLAVPIDNVPPMSRVFAGRESSFGLVGDTIYSWGYNGPFGLLADGTIAHRFRPAIATLLPTNIRSVAASSHGLAVHASGQLWAWGSNGFGQLGDGTTNGRLQPMPVTLVGLCRLAAAGDGHSISYQSPGNAVSGTVVLSDYTPSPNGQPIVCSFVDPGTGAFAATATTTLDDAGFFSVNTLLSGTYHVRAKASHWRSATVLNVDTSSGDVSGLAFNLLNGDVNGDDSVNAVDFVLLRKALGSGPSDVHWNAGADLNGDLTINIFDFLILYKNFGR